MFSWAKGTPLLVEKFPARRIWGKELAACWGSLRWPWAPAWPSRLYLYPDPLPWGRCGHDAAAWVRNQGVVASTGATWTGMLVTLSHSVEFPQSWFSLFLMSFRSYSHLSVVATHAFLFQYFSINISWNHFDGTVIYIKSNSKIFPMDV